MTEQLTSRERVIADAKLALELTHDLKAQYAAYSDDQLLQFTNFLSRFILDTSKRASDQSALLKFQFESGVV